MTAQPYRRRAEEETLISRLQALRDRDFDVAEEDAFPLALEIFDNLGSPDPELRDELGMTALGTWIVDRSTYFRLDAAYADARRELEQAQAQLALQP